jgi:hypothetical protein
VDILRIECVEGSPHSGRITTRGVVSEEEVTETPHFGEVQDKIHPLLLRIPTSTLPKSDDGASLPRAYLEPFSYCFSCGKETI